MAIYRPGPKLSKRDKQLLQLTAQLLLQNSEFDPTSTNLPEGTVPLSDSEAEELADLLDALVSHKSFLETSYFVEEITAQDDRNESTLKEIYLSSRKRGGRSRAMGSSHWSEFEWRLGIRKNIVRGTRTERMPFRHFIEMERRLFSSLGMHPRVASLLLRVIELHHREIVKLRARVSTIPRNTFKDAISNLTEKIRSNDIRLAYENLVSRTELCAVATFVANSSVIFTTRDWGVAGTISCMAGALMGMRRQD